MATNFLHMDTSQLRATANTQSKTMREVLPQNMQKNTHEYRTTAKKVKVKVACCHFMKDSRPKFCSLAKEKAPITS